MAIITLRELPLSLEHTVLVKAVHKNRKQHGKVSRRIEVAISLNPHESLIV
jgi:hypothetical protein